jgi:alkylation response protein AidB-like acyl-CoA dehydrogenase
MISCPSPAARLAAPERTTEQWIAIAETIGESLRADAVLHDASGDISRAAFDRLRSEGFTTALVPVAFGGGGARHADMGAILRTLARFDPAVALTLSMHAHLVAFQLWRHNHGMDASAVFSKVAGGALLISTGASDWVSSNGRARKVEGGFRVTARKAPASGCEIGELIVTSIRWDDAPQGPGVIHCAIPLAAEGVSIKRTWDTMGMRATGSHTIEIEDVFVPDAAVSLLRPADVWHPVWNIVVTAAMPLICAVYVGVADAAVAESRRLVQGRHDQHLVQLLGEMGNAHITACDLLSAMFTEAADLSFPNDDDGLSSRTLSRKTVLADAVIDTVRLGIEASGGRGYMRASDLERLYRDAHGSLFHPLPRARQTTFSGRVALGLSPCG